MPFVPENFDPQLLNSLKQLFEQNNLPIDLEKGTGMELFLAEDGEGSMNRLFDPRKLEAFHSKNPYNKAELNERFSMLKNGLESGSIMLQLPGEDSPRSLRLTGSNHTPELSQPVKNIKKPSRPGLFKRFFHALNKNLYQEDFEKYERQQTEYDRVLRQAQSAGSTKAVQERESVLNEARHASQQARMNAGLDQDRAKVEAFDKAARTVSELLDNMFSEAERNSRMAVNRTNMIAIDGRPISAILKEQLDNNVPDSLKKARDAADDSWAARGKKYILDHSKDAGKLVAAALLEGRHVQVFPVQKGGRINGEMRMLKADPVLNGLSEEEKQQAAEAAKGLIPGKKLSGTEAYARMDQANQIIIANNFFTEADSIPYGSPKLVMPFVQKWAEAHPDKVLKYEPGDNILMKIDRTRHFSTDRTALQATLTGALLHKGYSMQDILNPDKLSKEKQELVSDILDSMTSSPDDAKAGRKLAEYSVNGRLACIDYIKKELEGFDMTDPRQLFSAKGRRLVECAGALFDMGQERSHCASENKEYMLELCGNDTKKAEELNTMLETAANGFIADYHQGLNSQKKLLNAALGYCSSGEQFINGVGSFGLLESLQQLRKDNPEKNPLTLIPYKANFILNESQAIVMLSDSAAMQKYYNMRGAVNVEELGRSCFCGKIRKDLDFKYEGGHISMTLKSEQPTLQNFQEQPDRKKVL